MLRGTLRLVGHSCPVVGALITSGVTWASEAIAQSLEFRPCEREIIFPAALGHWEDFWGSLAP